MNTVTSIHPATQVGLIALTVGDLDRSLRFYTQAVGFTVLEQGPGTALLGVGSTPLLSLTEARGAAPAPARATGLYHFAILLPDRAALGRWLRHWLDLGLPVPGSADHLVSEALYLSDPDGNGIEVYRDRPREAWSWEGGRVRMATEWLDLRDLMSEPGAEEPWTGLPEGTRVGHVHLQVANIPLAEAFYHGVLGFDVVAAWPSALFVSAGGYHHHLGLNTWNSLGASPPPEGSAGLRAFTIELPSEEALASVTARLDAAGVPYERTTDGVDVLDPWRNVVQLRVVRG